MSAFVDVKEFRKGEVVATITERKATGFLSFKLTKEYKMGSDTRQSAFLSHHHLEDARHLMGLVESYFNDRG